MTTDTVSRFVVWFVKIVAADVPSAAYGSGTSEVVVQGSSEDNDPLFRIVTRHPMATDADGFYHRPSQAAIESIRFRNPKRAAYLRSIALGGDWEAAGWRLGLDGVESRAYAIAAIRDFHSRYRARAVGRAI